MGFAPRRACSPLQEANVRRGYRIAKVLLLFGVATVGQAQSAPGAMIWGGLERTYRIHVPAARDGGRSVPLLIALHGGGGTGEKMERLALGGLTALAERAGFVVVYPDGIEKHWNDGRAKVKYRAHREKIDDVGFIAALIDRLAQEHGIDRQRVYVTGISNGGMMSNRLACELADKIAGIAPVAANMPADLVSMCAPSRPISVLMMGGVDDPMMPWAGGEAHFLRRKFGQVLSAMDTIKFWAAHNRCSAAPTVAWEADADREDGTRVRKETYHGCRDGVEVVLYAIEGGGHTWPGGYQYLPKMVVGKTSRDMDANEVIWRFFGKHATKHAQDKRTR